MISITVPKFKNKFGQIKQILTILGYFNKNISKLGHYALESIMLSNLQSLQQMRNYGRGPREAKTQGGNERVRFESGMTSEQQFHSIAQSVMSNLPYQEEAMKGCTMHPKLSKKCRKCQQIQKNYQTGAIKTQELVIDQTFPQIIKLNTNHAKSHFNEKLQKNIEDSFIFKTKVKTVTNVRDLCNSLTSDQISIDAYMAGSSDMPTQFICFLYRLSELRPTHEQLLIMLRANNVNIRCLALLYLRAYADPTLVYGCICNSFKDNKLLSTITIGEYALRLFDDEQLNHGGFRIPRLPIRIQKQIQRRIQLYKEKINNKIERQRSRSRERKRKREQEEQLNREHESSESESSSSQSSQIQDKKENIKIEGANDKPEMTLKQKIRLITQKNQAEQRRRDMIQSYKAQNIVKLDSEEQANSEEDQVQKYRMG